MIIVMLNIHRSHMQLIRDGVLGQGAGWGSVICEKLIPAPRPMKTRETITRKITGTINVKGVGTR